MSPRKRKHRRPAYRDAMKRRQPDDPHTIPSFCAANHISVSLYFTLKREGKGPRETLLGKRVIITAAAARDWLAAREAESVRKREQQAASAAAAPNAAA
jgi:hypothetical protein